MWNWIGNWAYAIFFTLFKMTSKLSISQLLVLHIGDSQGLRYYFFGLFVCQLHSYECDISGNLREVPQIWHKSPLKIKDELIQFGGHRSKSISSCLSHSCEFNWLVEEYDCEVVILVGTGSTCCNCDVWKLLTNEQRSQTSWKERINS